MVNLIKYSLTLSELQIFLTSRKLHRLLPDFEKISFFPDFSPTVETLHIQVNKERCKLSQFYGEMQLQQDKATTENTLTITKDQPSYNHLWWEVKV